MRQIYIYIIIFVIIYIIHRKTIIHYENNKIDGTLFTIQKPDNWTSLPLYKKINHYKSILTRDYSAYVDKLSAKNIVKNICGDRCKIPEVIRILKNPSDLKQSDLNDDVLIKASHGSGWLIDPLNNKNLEENINKLKLWDKIYSNHEKQYKYLQPKFFIEKKLNCFYNGLTGSAVDIKVFCFYGNPKFLLVRNMKKRNFYDMNWVPIKNLDFDFEKPSCYNEIIDISKDLSKPFEFVRIDLYIGIDGIYFSEFTFTPMSGKKEFSDEKELELGKYWY